MPSSVLISSSAKSKPRCMYHMGDTLNNQHALSQFRKSQLLQTPKQVLHRELPKPPTMRLFFSLAPSYGEPIPTRIIDGLGPTRQTGGSASLRTNADVLRNGKNRLVGVEQPQESQDTSRNRRNCSKFAAILRVLNQFKNMCGLLPSASELSRAQQQIEEDGHCGQPFTQ